MLTDIKEREHIEQITLEILERNNYQKGIVPLLEIVRNEFGYGIYIDVLDSNMAGKVNYSEKEIILNKKDIPRRQFFTLAHELGHIYYNFYDNKKKKDNNTTVNLKIAYRRDFNYYQEDSEEQWANYFAACLLMPEKVFKEKFNEVKKYYNHNDEANEKIVFLANYFGVSRIAALIRANSLGLVDDYYFK